jgi:hypothetical protein
VVEGLCCEDALEVALKRGSRASDVSTQLDVDFLRARFGEIESQ